MMTETETAGIEPSGGEAYASALLLAKAQEMLAFQTERADEAEARLAEASVRLGLVRRLGELWAGLAAGAEAADVGRAILAALSGGPGVPPRPQVVCLCGSTRFYDEFQQANYDLTMKGAIVLSVGFYPHAKAVHGHGEGVGHDSAEKAALDELHKRKIDLADEVLVVSDPGGYFGQSTAGEVAYAVAHGRPVRFAEPEAERRARDLGLLAGKGIPDA